MTTAEDTVIRRKLRLIRKHTNELTHLIPSDDAIADTTGLTREIERILGTYRRKLEQAAGAEMETIHRAPEDRGERVNKRVKRAPVAVGKQYELVPHFDNIYTFNMPALVVGIAKEKDTDIAATLWSLIQSKAVKMTTGIQAIQRYVDNNGIALKMVHQETITNDDGLDGPWVALNRVQNGVDRVELK